MNKNLFLLIVVLLISSCQRSENEHYFTTVHGKVLDLETLDPIPGITVRVFRIEPATPNTHHYFLSGTSTADGSYSFSFVAEKDSRNYTTAFNINYLTVGFVYTPFGQDNYINVLLSKPGFLNIHVKNVNPVDSLDKIDIFGSDYYADHHIASGMNTDTNIIVAQYGNRPGYLNWKIQKTDTTYAVNQQINFISNDTVQFEILY